MTRKAIPSFNIFNIKTPMIRNIYITDENIKNELVLQMKLT